MLRDTLGSYIDNLLRFFIFLGVGLLLLLVLVLLSKRSKDKLLDTSSWFKFSHLLHKNLMALGLIFLSLLLLALLVTNIALAMAALQLGGPVYMLGGFIILLVMMAVYVVKSRIFSGDK
ncbi:MAG: hypothetical protein PHN32_00590 [Actinomycetota bacterium]|nr:hypothetical protein [Actinomycetota bacterium]